MRFYHVVVIKQHHQILELSTGEQDYPQSPVYSTKLQVQHRRHCITLKHLGYRRVCKFYWRVESVWLLLHKLWSHFGIFGIKYHNEKSQTDFPAHGPGMYTLSWGIHKVAVVVRWPGKLKSMMAFECNLPSSFFAVQYNSLISMI